MELEKMQKVNEILQLCFEINGLEQRQRKYTGEKPTVFFEFSGHIALLKIQIHKTGWYAYEETREYAQPDIRLEIHLNDPYKEIKEYMEECIVYLKELKNRMEKSDNYEHLQQAI
ncbi:hypothetical protein [Clostridium sp. MD294]|uniref:hypothetical protein n=1 Tax=Clostridium sp. MD294 TaxID=97138 RepID=UPI0002CA96D7|nr:hypothetical protein [Clostridium sp. MD294]NDO45992.1 hypothetical protein [Clostridium sp. MD294]USF30347.1 hypothetical protein C820_001788 [Clostridium sp. MD294]